MAATFKSRRLTLAKFLEKNVTDSQYDHSRFGDGHFLDDPRCAAGWAAVAGIGGLYYAGTFSTFGIKGNNNDNYNDWVKLESVFGTGTFGDIFSSITSDIHTRQDAITALRNF